MSKWNKTTKWKRRMIARILDRDGEDCWLCARPMPDPPKRSNKRRSLEHLTSRCQGGSDEIDNLVVCHQHCNKALGLHSREEKHAIRRKWHAEWKRQKKGHQSPENSQPAR